VFTSDDSAVFSFFESSNWELMIKVLDACALNGSFWTFFAATTNVELTITVRDLETGQERVYRNPLGQSADAVTDTSSGAPGLRRVNRPSSMLSDDHLTPDPIPPVHLRSRPTSLEMFEEMYWQKRMASSSDRGTIKR
jgi:hypothetical protein